MDGDKKVEKVRTKVMMTVINMMMKMEREEDEKSDDETWKRESELGFLSFFLVFFLSLFLFPLFSYSKWSHVLPVNLKCNR